MIGSQTRMQGQIQPEARSADPVYVGIDVCKERLDVYLHPLGRRLSVANHGDGLRRLKRALAGHAVALVVMEATGKYHRPACRSLHRAGFAVAVVNPVRSRRFAEAIGTLAKTDRVDARMLALFGAALGPQARPPTPEALEALQELVRTRNAATAERTAAANRLAASRDPVVRKEMRRQVKSRDSLVARLSAEIARRIAEEPALARRYEILVSIPGVGSTVAADLIAELPELGALDRHAAACLAGLAPFADDSGGSSGHRHIRGGRAHARRALYWAALAASRHNPDLRAFYRRLRALGKAPKLALTAVMRKIVILANTLISEDRPWIPVQP